ncbi:MAG: sulfatase [Candidatus Aadella gelida]|nr:sulfatase [Candidatus Aadella gelida]
MNDLHFFKDMHISKSFKLARFLNAVMSFLDSAKKNRLLFGTFLSAIILLSIALTRVAAFISGGGVSFPLLLVVLQVVFVLLSYISFGMAKRISKRFRSKLDVGVRDSWLFLVAFNAYIICLVPVGGVFIILSFVAAGLLTLSLLAFIGYLYEKKIAVKKQPDLDIPEDLDVDEEIDFELLENTERRKVQIEGDTRDAILLGAGEETRIAIKGSVERIKFAVGIRESLRTTSPESTLIKVYEERGENSRLLYSKELDPVTDPNSRGWIEVALDVEANPEEAKRNLLIKVESDTEARKESPVKYCCFSGPRVSGKKNSRKVILIVLDAVRYDQLGCYGNSKNITPNIDSLASDGVLYDNAIVQGEWTLPSFMSMLSGLYPSAHHVYHHTSYHTLDKRFPTLTQVLRKNGFITRNYFTHKRLMSHFGFARGFDSHIFRQCDKEWNIATADDVTDRALDMLSFHADDDLFLMLHYFDTHQPCDPPSPYSEMFDKTYGKKVKKNVRQTLMDKKDEAFDSKDLDNLIARYNAEIFRADAKVGMIIDELKKTGQYDDAMIIVTADHGMLLNDHGSMTKITLFDETVKVPLVVKYPASLPCEKGVKVEDTIAEANLDLMPTILDSYGIEKPEHLQGRSLCGTEKPELSKEKSKGYAISESLFGNSYTVSLKDKEYRYIFKTNFDISNFTNYASNNTEEAVFKTAKGSPEAKIEGAEAGELIKKYSPLVKEHIENVLKVHNNKK